MYKFLWCQVVSIATKIQMIPLSNKVINRKSWKFSLGSDKLVPLLFLVGSAKPYCFPHWRRMPSAAFSYILLIIIAQITTWYAHFNTRNVTENLCLTEAAFIKDFKTHKWHVSKGWLEEVVLSNDNFRNGNNDSSCSTQCL